jgi:hypothetical protein
VPAVRWRGRLLAGLVVVCAGMLVPAAGLAAAPSSTFNGRAHFVFSGATTRLLTVRPTARGNHAVRTRHQLRVLVWVTYTPTGGMPQTIRLSWGKFSGSFFGG